MTRRLRADEQELWARVAQTVNPLHAPRTRAASSAGVAVPQLAVAPPPLPRRESGPRRAAPFPAAPPRVCGPAPHAESLDASWDRRLAGNRLQPDLVIDLHGLRRDQARHLLYEKVRSAEARGLRVLLVITGKGQMAGPSPADLMEGKTARGAIRADFPRWLGEAGLTDRIAAVRRAHPRHGGAGAAYLILKRRRA